MASNTVTVPSASAIEQINPLTHMRAKDYDVLWQKLFSTILSGFWGRFIFLTLLISAIYFGIRMRNPTIAGTCLILAAMVAYGAGAVNLVMSLIR